MAQPIDPPVTTSSKNTPKGKKPRRLVPIVPVIPRSLEKKSKSGIVKPETDTIEAKVKTKFSATASNIQEPELPYRITEYGHGEQGVDTLVKGDEVNDFPKVLAQVVDGREDQGDVESKNAFHNALLARQTLIILISMQRGLSFEQARGF